MVVGKDYSVASPSLLRAVAVGNVLSLSLEPNLTDVSLTLPTRANFCIAHRVQLHRCSE